jgi:hypothetical protein
LKMGAPRKNPPANAVVEIRRLAAAGSTYVGIAKYFRVAKETLNRWLEEDFNLAEAFEQGKDEEREKLHNALSKKALAGDIVAAMFLLKSRHKYDDRAGQRVNVAVDVAVVPPVMIVRDHGSDEEWAAKVAEQQRALTQTISAPAQLEAPGAAQINAVQSYVLPVALVEEAAVLTPSYAPPNWTPKA